MTFRPERRASNKILLGVATAVLTAASLYLAKTVWATKVDVTDFTLHVAEDDRREQAYKLDRQLDSVWHAEQAVKTDEILCTVKPRSKACRTP